MTFKPLSWRPQLLRLCSASDETVGAALRGKYGAFAEEDSAGVRHLRELKEAGLTHVHLLPTYDFATVPERERNQLIIEVRLSGFEGLYGTSC